MEVYKKNNYTDLINFLNSFTRQNGCIGNNATATPYCKAMWLSNREVDNGEWSGLDLKDRDNDFLMERADSYVTDVDAKTPIDFDKYQTNLHSGRVELTQDQTTYMAIKFGFDLIIRGHEFKQNGFQFTHPRVLTNHGRPLTGVGTTTIKGSICLIDYTEIIFLQFSTDVSYENEEQFQKYMSYTN